MASAHEIQIFYYPPGTLRFSRIKVAYVLNEAQNSMSAKFYPYPYLLFHDCLTTIKRFAFIILYKDTTQS